jgi:hypothetical protein
MTPYAKKKEGESCTWFDVYWLYVAGDGYNVTGSKYLEYISRIRILTTIEQWLHNIAEMKVKRKQRFDWRFDHKEKKTKVSRNAKYTVNALQILYVNHAKKTLKGDFAANQGGMFWLSPLREIRQEVGPQKI